jgi:hypothetical protein
MLMTEKEKDLEARCLFATLRADLVFSTFNKKNTNKSQIVVISDFICTERSKNCINDLRLHIKQLSPTRNLRANQDQKMVLQRG